MAIISSTSGGERGGGEGVGEGSRERKMERRANIPGPSTVLDSGVGGVATDDVGGGVATDDVGSVATDGDAGRDGGAARDGGKEGVTASFRLCVRDVEQNNKHNKTKETIMSVFKNLKVTCGRESLACLSRSFRISSRTTCFF